MSISRVGVDIAKSVFNVRGVDRHDQVEWRGKYKRDKWLDAIVKRVPTRAVIGMEACASVHHWAREPQDRLCLVLNRTVGKVDSNGLVVRK